MALSGSLLGFLLIRYVLVLSFKYSEAQLVPAVYVFGDSAVDVGNNNYLPLTLAKADYPYNGIDFPTKIPTGRFSNGKNAADFLCEKLGLPSSPPFLSLSFNNKNATALTGVNFASGASGIFNSTGQSLGMVIPLRQQVDYYASVHRDLVQKLGLSGAKKHLSKSIFTIVTGSNDISSYFGSSDSRNKKNPQQYAECMILLLKRQLKKLYTRDARKFVIPGVPIIGCSPSQRLNTKAEECNKDVNSLAIKYNTGLKSMLQQFKTQLKDINYSYFDIFGALQSIIQKPNTYGFTEVKAACCGLGKLNAELPCLPVSTYCSNRSNHVFWDIVHPTEATARILVNAVFDGPSKFTFPVNVRQLVAL